MSTKIFGGKAIYDISTLYELEQRVDEMRKVCGDLAKEEASKLIANKLSFIIDKDNNEDHDTNWIEELGDIKLMGAYDHHHRVKEFLRKFVITNALSDNDKEEKHYSALIFLYELLQEKRNIIRELGRRDPSYDFDLNVSFYPLKDKILFSVNCENDKMYREAIRILGGEDYGYWDNTDPDKNVTEEEWEQRREDWNEVIDKGTTLQGFSVEIWGDYDYLDNFWMMHSHEEGSEALVRTLSNIPSKKDRAEKLAFSVLRRDCLRSKMEGVEETAGRIVESNYNCVEYFRSDEGRKEIEEKAKGYHIQDIDAEVLKNKKLKKPEVENGP